MRERRTEEVANLREEVENIARRGHRSVILNLQFEVRQVRER